MLVEDSEEDALQLIDALRRGGYEPDWQRVETEAALRAALTEREWDVVFCDYSMPHLNAPDALRILRENGDALAAIVVSGQVGEEVAVETMRMGANDFILNHNLDRIGSATARELRAAALRRERGAAALALRQSEERLRQMAENPAEVFWMTDPAKKQVLYVSPAYEKIWGRTCASLYAEPTSASVLDTIHPEDHQRVEEAFSRPIEGSFDLTYRIVRPDGAWRWIYHRSYPVRNEAGEIYRLAGIATDITEAKNAAQQICEQAALLDHAQDAILVQDLDGQITYWNKSAERLYGWTAEEVRGCRAEELLYASPEPYRVSLEVTLRQGAWIGEMSKRPKTGGSILVESRWTLVRDEVGRPKAILVIDTDLTGKKALEGQVFRAQRMESIGTLAGGIAHDLNNVLGPIIMAVDLLKLSVTDPRDLDLLETMETSGRRGADMVKQVLLFARGDEGERGLVGSGDVVKELERIVRETFPKSITIEAATPPGTWNISGDRTQLHQVLLNLCVNARDAMPRGGRLRISARNRTIDEHFAAMCPDAHPGSYVVLEVADTGEGMTPETLAQIFDPFFTTKKRGQGTGLGLSTTRAIVKSHGGFMTVESAPGKGTTFLVNLPADTAPAHEQSVAHATEFPRGQGELILVIDDEASIRSITSQTLEVFGYRVMSAGDGAAGVAQYAQHRHEIAAVVTDMMMPVMDGAAAIQVLLRINPAVKIIAASGSSGMGAKANTPVPGAKYFLPKPFSAETLLRTLDELLHAGA
ncbi:MAG: PAS domain S-box protein [Chthoniobacter sp.]